MDEVRNHPSKQRGICVVGNFFVGLDYLESIHSTMLHHHQDVTATCSNSWRIRLCNTVFATLVFKLDNTTNNTLGLNSLRSESKSVLQ